MSSIAFPLVTVSPGSEFSPRSTSWGAACWRRMLDRPKWSTLWSSLFTTIGISGDGLVRAMRPGGDAPLEAKLEPHALDHAAASLQRKGVLVFHIACRMTASFRAIATRAFLKPTFLASLRPQALRVEKAVVLVSNVVAAS
jgi:hypothetical protein